MTKESYMCARHSSELVVVTSPFRLYPYQFFSYSPYNVSSLLFLFLTLGKVLLLEYNYENPTANMANSLSILG